MSDVGHVERKTQHRVVGLFADQLGYRYQGDWEHRAGNSNFEQTRLVQNLRARGYADNLINRALDQLGKASAVGGGHDLFEANREV